METVGLRITADGDCSHEIKRHFLLGMKVLRNLESIFKKQRRHFADKGIYNQSYNFLSSHVRNKSPVYVRCRIQDAWGWCTGMTQRDGMGREVGGGLGLGTHVHPWRIHVDVWQN